MARSTFNTATIRELLNSALSDNDLEILCFDHFRAVYDQFTRGMDRKTKIQCLIVHCEQFGEFPRLIRLVKQANPYQYSQFRDSLHVMSDDGDETPRAIVEVTISGDLKDCPEPCQEYARLALAGILKVESHELVLKFVRSGSIVLLLEMSHRTLLDLLILQFNASSELQAIGVLAVTFRPSHNIPPIEVRTHVFDDRTDEEIIDSYKQSLSALKYLIAVRYFSQEYEVLKGWFIAYFAAVQVGITAPRGVAPPLRATGDA
jgi:hypothetical protein